MKKVLLTILMVALLFGTVQAANRFGDTYHAIQVKDETGRNVTDITNVFIYLAGTTTNATIYSDKGRQNTITIPMTEASANTTLVNGLFTWWGPDTWDFSMSNTDAVGPMTNAGHADRTSNESTLIFPSYLSSINTSSFLDAETLTMGTGSDWVFQAGNVANQLSFTPAADDSTVNFGVSGTGLNTNFNVFTGTALGFKLSSAGATHSMTYDGGIVNLNANSNFAVNIATGTSTGATTIGNSAGGAIAFDTDTSITFNADDSIDMTTSGAAADIDIDAAAGSVIIDGGEAIADAVIITAPAGGVDILAAPTFDIDIIATGGKVIIGATENAAGSISISANGGASETMLLSVVQGTGVASIDIDSTLGGITISANAAGKDIEIDSVLGSINIEAEEDVALAILITVDGGTSSTMRLFNDTGTGATSIELLSDLGGITFNASAGLVAINATGATAGDITLTAGDIMSFVHTDVLEFSGAATETWVIEGTANGFETTLVFTDPTADGTMTFPDLGDEGAAGGEIAWIADGGSVTKDGTNAALPVTDALVLGTSTAASAWSLPNGEEGQILTVVIVTDGGVATITPDTPNASWATVVLTDDIDGVTFQYIDDTIGWMILGTFSDGTNLVEVTQ